MHAGSFTAYQADMRGAYANGAPGAMVSGIVWLCAAAITLALGPIAGMWLLILGGMTIFPLSLLVCRIFGATGKHAVGNPLGLLALEGTLWLMVGIFIAWATTFTGMKLFFPVMLLVIGSRYLTFQTLYGIRTYWLAGGGLCIAGFSSAVLSLSSFIPVAAGGAIEIALAVALILFKDDAQLCKVADEVGH